MPDPTPTPDPLPLPLVPATWVAVLSIVAAVLTVVAPDLTGPARGGVVVILAVLGVIGISHANASIGDHARKVRSAALAKRGSGLIDTTEETS